jgi:hypothetical protein
MGSAKSFNDDDYDGSIKSYHKLKTKDYIKIDSISNGSSISEDD